MARNTPKEAVCQVFEKVNTGGVTLTVFELLTATFAADDFQLRPDWEQRERAIHSQSILSGVSNTDFLQAVTLLTTLERRDAALRSGPDEDRAPAIGCKRSDMLRLGLDEYLLGDGLSVVEWAEKAPEIFPEQHLMIQIEYLDETTRRLTLASSDEHHAETMDAVKASMAKK